MMRSRDDDARLDRLASEVKMGGGLALPLFFQTILDELLDNAPVDNDRIVRLVARVGANKTRKLAETWNSSWEFLASDLMEQLASYGYATRDGDSWSIGPNFQAGVLLETIPARAGLNKADHVTAWLKEERELRNLDSTVPGRVTKTISQPRGKNHPPQVSGRLRESADKYGRLTPIIQAGDGRIIDGRHRHEIDPTWPRVTAVGPDGRPIETDEEILEAIRELQSWKKYEGLTKGAAEELDATLAALRWSTAGKRRRIEEALLEDATRSNRTVAELIGVSDNTVGAIREGLEIAQNAQLRIHCYVFTAGRGQRPGKHSAACWCGQGEAPPKRAKPQRSRPKAVDNAVEWLERNRSSLSVAGGGLSKTAAQQSSGASWGSFNQAWERLGLDAVELSPVVDSEVKPEVKPEVESQPDVLPAQFAGPRRIPDTIEGARQRLEEIAAEEEVLEARLAELIEIRDTAVAIGKKLANRNRARPEKVVLPITESEMLEKMCDAFVNILDQQIAAKGQARTL